MRFWRALLKALVHAIATVGATVLVWAVFAAWMVFARGQYDMKSGGPWGTYRFGMMVALYVALVLSGLFLMGSLVAHFIRGRLPGSRLALSSLTLALSSLTIWFALGSGGPPLGVLIFALPLASACWLIGPKQKRGRQEDIEPEGHGSQDRLT